MSEETLRAFYTAYGAALAAGDLTAIAAGYTLPALVLSDAGSIPLGHPEQIASTAQLAFLDYQARGVSAIHPRLTRVDPISATLTSVDITWLYQNAEGHTVLEEAYRYLVRLDEAARPLIQVVVSKPVG
jgi:hypothetical protein